MQVAIVRITSSEQNLGSPAVRETAFSSPNEDISRSQETLSNLPLTKPETVDEQTHSERKNTPDCERSTEVSRSTVNTSDYLKPFRKEETKSARLKKACEIVFVSMLLVATVSLQAVPPIVYFALEVSPCMQLHNNALLNCSNTCMQTCTRACTPGNFSFRNFISSIYGWKQR